MPNRWSAVHPFCCTPACSVDMGTEPEPESIRRRSFVDIVLGGLGAHRSSTSMVQDEGNGSAEARESSKLHRSADRLRRSSFIEQVFDGISRRRSSFVSQDDDREEDSGHTSRRRSFVEHLVALVTPSETVAHKELIGPGGARHRDPSRLRKARRWSVNSHLKQLGTGAHRAPDAILGKGDTVAAGGPPRPQMQRSDVLHLDGLAASPAPAPAKAIGDKPIKARKPVKPANLQPSDSEKWEEERKQRIQRLKMAKATAPKVKKAESKKREPLPETVQSLAKRIDELLARAQALEGGEGHVYGTLERRFGKALLDKCGVDGKLTEFVREFDRKQSGVLSKMEFRLLVRNGLGLKMDNTTIDEFFLKLDDDGGGSLDLKEVRAALKTFRTDGQKAEEDAEHLRCDAEALRERCVHLEEVRAETERYEELHARVALLRENLPLDARLGVVIVRRSLKLSDVISRWDNNGNGQLERVEFFQNIVELGLETDRAESDALFASFDEDDDGSLSIIELKPALKKLIDAATAKHHELEELTVLVETERRILDKRQRALIAAESAEEERIVETKEARRRAAEELREEALIKKREKEAEAKAEAKARADKYHADLTNKASAPAASGVKGVKIRQG